MRKIRRNMMRRAILDELKNIGLSMGFAKRSVRSSGKLSLIRLYREVVGA